MSRRNRLRNFAYYVIIVGFLIYGALRLNGAIPAFGQTMGWWDTDIGREIVEALAPGFPEMSAGAIVPLSIEVYMGWSALMGITLTVGSVLALFKLRIGYIFISFYYVLFAAGFINYLVFNVKLLHFGVALAFFVLALWLSDQLNLTKRQHHGDEVTTSFQK